VTGAAVHPDYCTHDEGERCDCPTPTADRPAAPAALSTARLLGERAAVVQRLTAQDWTLPEIAAELGVSVRTVYRLRGRAS
jgi:DNA-directed RNA polymerase specialized sigma24 family protein